MREPQWQFLEEVYLSNSVIAAIGRGPGSPTYVPNPTDEQRATLARELRRRLRDLQTRYSHTVEDQEHVQNIRELASRVSASCASFLNGGHLRFGRSQKVLNLYLKFLWCADRIPLPPHCPFDSLVIGSLPRPFSDVAWTKLDDESVYIDLVKAARLVAGSQPLAEWELRLWQDASLKYLYTPPNTMIRGQPAEVREQFLQTAGHPKATYRVARAPQGSATVQQGYREFLALWRNPGPDRPEVAIAKEFLVESGQQPQRFKPDTLVH